MNFSAEQISPGKWGIYSDSKLLATVSSEAICKTVIANLSSGRRDLPAQDTNALYQITAELKPPLTQPKPATAAANSANGRPLVSAQSSSQSTEVQSTEVQSTDAQSIEDMLDSLNEKQLEELLMKAQQGSIKDSLKVPLSHQRQPSKTKKARSANSRSASGAVSSKQKVSAASSAV